METLILEKKDEVYLTVDADPSIQRELSEFFTFYVPGYKFMPAFRNRMWDGKIRMFSQKTKEIYFGLFPYIKAFAEERGYNIVCGEDVEIDNKVDKNIVEKFWTIYYSIFIINKASPATHLSSFSPQSFFKLVDKVFSNILEFGSLNGGMELYAVCTK